MDGNVTVRNDLNARTRIAITSAECSVVAVVEDLLFGRAMLGHEIVEPVSVFDADAGEPLTTRSGVSFEMSMNNQGEVEICIATSAIRVIAKRISLQAFIGMLFGRHGMLQADVITKRKVA
jgi:hypothetical protein